MWFNNSEGTDSCDLKSVLICAPSGPSEGWTPLNDVSSVVGRKEGWTDGRLYLSLINLSNGVQKCLHLINKRDAAYAFPHRLACGRRRCEEGYRYLGGLSRSTHRQPSFLRFNMTANVDPLFSHSLWINNKFMFSGGSVLLESKHLPILVLHSDLCRDYTTADFT